MRLRDVFSATAFLFLLSFLLTGCSANFDQTEVSPGQSNVGTISGVVHGGQSAIVGAHVYVMGTSKTAYGGSGIAASTSNASTSLMTKGDGSDSNGFYVLTTAGGAFTVGGDYTCNLGQVVYLYVLGGNPGLTSGTNNTAAAEMAVLGPCPSNGGNLSSVGTGLFVDESTTVAAAYALAGFATDATHIGMSGSVLATTGINNAAATAGNMVNIQTGQASATARTTGATGVVPQALINTLSNIIGSCINTTGSASSMCTTLFQNATSDGTQCTTTCATEPSDTATAAINIAHHPGANATNATNNNIYNLYGLESGFSFFAPPLPSQPNDFSMQISFTGGGLTPQYGNGVDLAIDGSGNVWVVNSQDAAGDAGAGTTISKFSPLGVPANANGYTGGTNQLSTPFGIAISANSADVWIGDYDHGSVVDFNVSAGTGTEHTLPNGEAISALAFDSSGNLWGTDTNIPSLVKLSSSGSQLAYYTGNGLAGPFDLAIAPTTSGKIWIPEGGSGTVSCFSSTGGAVSNPSNPTEPTDVAIDSSGNAWVVTSSDASLHWVWKMNANGSGSTSYAVPGGSSGSGSYVWSDAMDGGNNLWVTGENTSATNNRIWEVNSSGVTVSGVAVGLAPSPSNTTKPSAIAVDGSGNVWYTSINDKTLHEIVGAAVPVVTPIATGTVNNTLASRP